MVPAPSAKIDIVPSSTGGVGLPVDSRVRWALVVLMLTTQASCGGQVEETGNDGPSPSPLLSTGGATNDAEVPVGASGGHPEPGTSGAPTGGAENPNGENPDDENPDGEAPDGEAPDGESPDDESPGVAPVLFCADNPCSAGGDPAPECFEDILTDYECVCSPGYVATPYPLSTCVDEPGCENSEQKCNSAFPCRERHPPHVGFTCQGEYVDWSPTDSPASFQIHDDGTVTDSNTGLTWQRAVEEETFASYEEVNDYCQTLTLAGRSWRVPHAVELRSLIDFHRTDPAIDPVAFPDTPSEEFWTVHVWLGLTHSQNVSFKDGSNIASATNNGRARCVEDVPVFENSSLETYEGLSVPFDRFEAQTDTVFDQITRLTWQRVQPVQNLTAADALLYCANLEIDGGGFRVPLVSELLSLKSSDIRSDPDMGSGSRLDPDFEFEEDVQLSNQYFLWSSTPYAADSEKHWAVYFHWDDWVSPEPFTQQVFVRCVK